MSKIFPSLLVAFSLLSGTLKAQGAHEKHNLWTGITATYDPGKKIGLVMDGGFRSFDQFTRKRKQILGRFVVFLNVTPRSSWGIGLAYFNHTSYDSKGTSRNRNEFRPFLQYQFRWRKNRHDIVVRARNEFRSFQNPESLRDRFRLQFRYAFQLLQPRIQVVCSAEGFYTFQKVPIMEQRYNLGVTIPLISKVQINPYYSLQLVSNLDVIQHVIGVQLQLNLDPKSQR